MCSKRNITPLKSCWPMRLRRVVTRDELHDAMSEMFARKGAFLLEVCVDEEDNVFPMIPVGNNITDILFNVWVFMDPLEKQSVISAFTENHAGVLNRITSVFLRRKINIESIKVSESSEIGRATCRVRA